jgi:hypothetical protein
MDVPKARREENKTHGCIDIVCKGLITYARGAVTYEFE